MASAETYHIDDVIWNHEDEDWTRCLQDSRAWIVAPRRKAFWAPDITWFYYHCMFTLLRRASDANTPVIAQDMVRQALICCVAGMYGAAARRVESVRNMPRGSPAARVLALQRLTYLAKG